MPVRHSLFATVEADSEPRSGSPRPHVPCCLRAARVPEGNEVIHLSRRRSSYDAVQTITRQSAIWVFMKKTC